MTTVPLFTAHNGFALPAIGLGTYRLDGDAGADAVAAGIGAGYRLVDTAFNYENEGSVGRGVAASGTPRGDLHLIHWPNPSQDEYVQAWAALVDAQSRGVVRQIGVSNFLPEHLERSERETGVRPVVNQIEVHPYFPQEEQLAYHREQGILTEAWSPIGRGEDLLEEAVVGEVAAAHGITAAQAVLAWHVARGTVAIPKASSLEHQAANLAAAEIVLDDAEVAAITALGRPDGRLFDGDPRTHEES
ncbi:aldo/keto reductase [Microbacterium algeriense]|uniref:aldo/keto reductase n=1 Tax=Microbacterium algeriense TaxID=2615184 RepID=UPI003D70C5B7